MATLTRSTGSSTLRLISQSCVGSSSRHVPQRTYKTKPKVLRDEFAVSRPKKRLQEKVDYSAASTEGLDVSLLKDVLPNTDEKSYVVKWRGKGFPFINSLRHKVSVVHPHLYHGPPMGSLTVKYQQNGGRGADGKIVARNRGGGVKRRLRALDFHRWEGGIHDVIRIEDDPGRTAHIALIRRRVGTSGPNPKAAEADLPKFDEHFKQVGRDGRRSLTDRPTMGGWSYILAPDGLRPGDTVISYRQGIPEGLIGGFGSSQDLRLVRKVQAEKIMALRSRERLFDAHDNIEEILRKEDKILEEHETDEYVRSQQSAAVRRDEDGAAQRNLGTLRRITLKPGNVLPLYLIPIGVQIHNISLRPDGPGQLCRSAGTSAVITAHMDPDGESYGPNNTLHMGNKMRPDGSFTPAEGYVLIKLSSGEVRKVMPGCVATIGMVSNKEKVNEVLGKAGASRARGRRPKVRGSAMNIVDHPHGGGRGKGKSGKPAISWSGRMTAGVRTRRPRGKGGNKMVVQERPRIRLNKGKKK